MIPEDMIIPEDTLIARITIPGNPGTRGDGQINPDLYGEIKFGIHSSLIAHSDERRIKLRQKVKAFFSEIYEGLNVIVRFSDECTECMGLDGEHYCECRLAQSTPITR